MKDLSTPDGKTGVLPRLIDSKKGHSLHNFSEVNTNNTKASKSVLDSIR